MRRLLNLDENFITVFKQHYISSGKHTAIFTYFYIYKFNNMEDLILQKLKRCAVIVLSDHYAVLKNSLIVVLKNYNFCFYKKLLLIRDTKRMYIPIVHMHNIKRSTSALFEQRCMLIDCMIFHKKSNVFMAKSRQYAWFPHSCWPCRSSDFFGMLGWWGRSLKS